MVFLDAIRKAQTTETKVNKWGPHQTKNPWQKNQNEKAVFGMRENTSNCFSYKGLIIKIYKEVLQLRGYKADNPI